MPTSAWVVDRHLPPYCSTFSLSTIESSIYPPTIRSNCFDKTAVNEIGLEALLMLRGGLIFGMVITIADLQIAGGYRSGRRKFGWGDYQRAQERATVREPCPPEIFWMLDAQMSMYCNSKQ